MDNQDFDAAKILIFQIQINELPLIRQAQISLLQESRYKLLFF